MTSLAPWCALYFCCLLAAGYGITALLSNLTKIERFGFAACIGPGITGLILLAISFAGHAPTRAAILAIGFAGAIATIASLFQTKTKTPLPNLPPPPQRLKILAGLAIAYALTSVAYDALIYPTFDWDAFSVWQLKAKVLTLEPMRPQPAYFTNMSLRYSDLRYPLLVPMISAGMHAMTGQITDELANTPYILLYFGITAALYGYTRRDCGQSIALCAAALFATVPALLDMAVSGLADMSLVAFYGCSIIFILRWQSDSKIIDAFFASLTTLCLAWTKNEGAMLALINFLVLLFLTPKPLRPKNLLAAFSLGLTILLLFHVPYHNFLPPVQYAVLDYPTLMTPSRMFANFDRLGPIAQAMTYEFLNLKNGSLFWPILAVVAILDFKNIFTRPLLVVWALFLLHLAAYIPPYLVTPLNLKALFPVTLPRLFPHLLPAAALLAALHAKNLIVKNPKPQPAPSSAKM